MKSYTGQMAYRTKMPGVSGAKGQAGFDGGGCDQSIG
jgi:hypothetical protein